MAKRPPQPSRLQAAVSTALPQPQPLQIQNVTQTYSGPIPHPDDLRRYDEIIPGAAERILRMAELENQHRHQQEDLAIHANIQAQQKQVEINELQTRMTFKSDSLGQSLGFVVTLLSLGGCLYLASINQPWVAGALVGLPLAGVIRALRNQPTSAPPKP